MILSSVTKKETSGDHINFSGVQSDQSHCFRHSFMIFDKKIDYNEKQNIKISFHEIHHFSLGIFYKNENRFVMEIYYEKILHFTSESHSKYPA